MQYGAVRLAELFVRSLPPAGLARLADAAGRLWYALDGRRRERASENLRVAFGSLPASDRILLAQRAFGQLLRVPLEVLAAPRFVPDLKRLKIRVRALGDYDLFCADVAAGRGGLVVAGHLGSWEIAARSLLLAGVPARAVMRPLDNPLLNRRIVGARGGDRRVIGKQGAARAVLATLREQRWAALLADQNAGRHGVFVPFFGLAASTHALPAVLALRLGLPLYATACLRAERGPWTFDLHFRRLLPPGPPRQTSPSAETLLTRMSEAIEAWVRLDPAQYNWIHRRWKSRPPGEVPGPGIPAYAVSASI